MNILKRGFYTWKSQGTRVFIHATLSLLAQKVLPKNKVIIAYTRDFLKGPQFDIGEYTYGVPSVLSPGGRLNIGKFCSIGSGVTIFLGGDHATEAVTTYPLLSAFPQDGITDDNKGIGSHDDVTIGNDVWIGHGATILGNVKIGDGAVIGAMAVVASDIPPYAVAVGNPARVIKYRFDENTINKLLELRWWNWPLEKIKAKKETIMSTPQELLLKNDSNEKS
jgi:acetyltransferase-like isoleucine patch superfamily enzyme